ncbi:MAG TPA: HAMP domain-containing sensor histidine kinase [Anaerohalosphaeraceae bacterium]|nr:HAMP domain-containing sensor histidine kinase [Anaerohalosphaeraceae bacterium]
MSEVQLLESIEQSAQMDEKDRHYAQAGKALRELSHALKNILQMVGGAAEVIDYAFQLKQMDKVEKGWPILSQNVKRMKKNLMDILDYTKKQNLEKCPCNLNEELKRMLNSLKSIGQIKKFKLQAQLDSALPEVNIDPERIGLMTLNMLLNAIDQVPEEAGVVTIQTRYMAPENQFEICVSDNGEPYTPEFGKQLFTPHETHKQRFGTGIGIMLAQQIANQHEGQITVHSAAGQNSLSAILPLKV